MFFGRRKQREAAAPAAALAPAPMPKGPAAVFDQVAQMRMPVHPTYAARNLVAWMQREAAAQPAISAAYSGWYTVEEMADWWAAYCEAEAIVACHEKLMLEQLRVLPGVRYRSRVRLRAEPEFRRVFERLKDRAGWSGKATLYFIPTAQQQADAERLDGHGSAASAPAAGPRSVGAATAASQACRNAAGLAPDSDRTRHGRARNRASEAEFAHSRAA